MEEPDLAVVEQTTIGVLRRDHDEFLPVEGEVPLDQRQRAFADRAETDHDNGTGDAGVNRPFGHIASLQRQ